MKFSTYFSASVLLLMGTVYYAFYTYRQFYPTVLFLVSSKLSYVVIGNMVFAVGLLIAKIFKTLFFGQLRDTEVEHLVDTAKYTIPETCLALTIFRNELTPSVGVLFGALIFVKLLHKLSKCRVEYQEQLLPIPFGSQLRVYALLAALAVIDIAGTVLSVLYVHTYGRSVIILFGFEFGLLIFYTINMSIRFVIQILDSMSEAGVASKGLYLMLTDMVCEILKFVTYMCLFGLVFYYYGIPIHILRDVYMAFLSCQRKVTSFVKYLQLTRNLDSRFEDATPEELIAAGNCLVCHEAMTTGKKLQCGHVFHLDCLRMWLQHQQICPLCRAPINAVANAPIADAAPAAGAGVDALNGPPEAAEAPVVPAAGAVGAIGGDVAHAAAAGAAVPVVAPVEAPALAPVAGSSSVSASSSSAHGDGKNTTLMAGVLASAESSGVVNTAQSGRFGVTQTAGQRASALSLELPAFFAVVGEPAVAVLLDPVLGAEEVRRIETGTIVFVTARVQGGDSTAWLKVPGGWILESQGSIRQTTLFSVIPISSSNSVEESDIPVSGEKADPADTVESAVPEPRVYSRSAARSSRLLNEFETKRTSTAAMESVNNVAEKPEPLGDVTSRSVRAPFSAMLDVSDSDERTERLPSSVSVGTSFVLKQQSRTPSVGVSDVERAIEDHLQELRYLLAQHSGGQYDSLYEALAESSPRLRKHSAEGNGPNQRLRQLATMQVHMEQVTRNLAALSENVLHSHNELSRMIQGEIDSAEPDSSNSGDKSLL